MAEQTSSSENKEHEQVYRALVGDIGGTNIRLRLLNFTKSTKKPNIIKESENLKSLSFNSFGDSVAHFLNGVSE